MIPNSQPLQIAAMTATCAAGEGLQSLAHSLQCQTSHLQICDFETVELSTYIGKVKNLETETIPADFVAFDCRNNRLAALGLRQDNFFEEVQACIKQVGSERVGVFLGTSTSGMLQAELAYRELSQSNNSLPKWFHYRETHNTYSVAAFVRQFLGVRGPAWTVSTACSSSAKVFATADRMIRMGLIDAAIVGGVDTLCLTTLYGFNSLQLLSNQPCRPYDQHRNGISIGEAAAFALLRKSNATSVDAVHVLGIGESSDAHHMSSPHPLGLGAQLAMENAIKQAGLLPSDIGYLNLHGTATPSNDKAEALAVQNIFGEMVSCSSTKGVTGHTLGAAGALEVVIAALALQQQMVWGSVNTKIVDSEFKIGYKLDNEASMPRYAMSNSFGFGGSNCSLVLGKSV